MAARVIATVKFNLLVFSPASLRASSLVTSLKPAPSMDFFISSRLHRSGLYTTHAFSVAILTLALVIPDVLFKDLSAALEQAAQDIPFT